MIITKVKIRDIRKNPFRNFEDYPLIERKVEALKASIQETGFWNNVLGREKDGTVEIAYGHHRLEAARQILGDDSEITITLRPMTDIEMFRIMGLENSEEWMNQIQHGELIIKRARAFFDSWLEQFSTWEDFVQGVRNNPLPEFGQSADAAINQVTDWLGGAAKAAANYAYIVKYGVGATILHRFTGISEAEIKKALSLLGNTAREKRMLNQIEAERKAAEEEAARQQRLKVDADLQKQEAEDRLKDAENERRRQAAIAQRTEDDQRKRQAEAQLAFVAAAKQQAKADKKAAEQAQKEAAKALREAEEKAKKASAAELRKRKADFDQQHYDENATKVWEKWVHAEEFKRLCLIPGNRHLLPKERQLAFAQYLKGLISGEITVARIQIVFNREVKAFVNGIIRRKEAENPLFKLENVLKAWDTKMAAITQQTTLLMQTCEANRVSSLTDYWSDKIEDRIRDLTRELGWFCLKHGLDVNYLIFNPPVHEKTISTVRSRALRDEEGDCNGFTALFPDGRRKAICSTAPDKEEGA